MSQRKSGILLSYMVILFHAIIGLAYIPLLLQYMTQSEYGLYRLMGSIMAYLAIMDFGMTTVITRFYTHYRARKDKVKTENTVALCGIVFMLSTMLIIAIGSGFYFCIENVFSDSLNVTEIVKAKRIYILFLVNLFCLLLVNFFNALISSHEKFVFLKSILLLQIIFQPFFIIQAMRVTPEAFSAVVIQTVFSIFLFIIKGMYCWWRLKIKIRFHYWDKEVVKEIRNLSVGLFAIALVDQIFLQANQLILGSVSGTLGVAVYSIAMQIYLNYLSIAGVFMNVFLPKVTEMIAQGASIEDLSNLCIRTGRLQFLLLGAVLSGFILYGQEFIFLWVGEGYLSAYYIAIAIMIPFTINLTQTMGVIILQAKNQYRFRACLYIIVGILNVLAAIPAAQYYGGIGCAMVTGACYIVADGIIMNIYYAKKIGLDIKRFWKEIGQIGSVVFLCACFGFLLFPASEGGEWKGFILKISYYALLYSCMVWKFTLNSFEKHLILQGIQKVKERLIR